MKGTCATCGQFAGGHFAGCPEDTDEEGRETPEIEPDTDAEEEGEE